MSVVHGLKVLAKEDYTPLGVDVPVFTLAPVAVFLTTVMTLLVIPFAPGLYGQDFNIGLLYFFAIGGLNVVGLMMAGWASFNKYALLGALRAAAQAISYEIPLTLSVVGVDHPGRDDEPELDRRSSRPARSSTGTSGSSRWACSSSSSPRIAEANRTPARHDRGRPGARGRLRHRVLGDALRLLLLRRVRQRLRRVGARRRPLLRRLERAVRLAVAGHAEPGPGRAGARPRSSSSASPRSSGRSSWASRSGSCRAGSARSRRSSSASSCSTSLAVGGPPGLGVHQLRLGRRSRLDDGQDLRLRVRLRPDARRRSRASAWTSSWASPGSGSCRPRSSTSSRRPCGLDRGDRVSEGRPMSRMPGLGIAQGDGLHPAPVLPAGGDDPLPGGGARTSRSKYRGRLQLLYDEHGTLKCETCFQCAQACPIECIDMGGADTKEPLRGPLGRAPRRTASGARNRPSGAPAARSRIAPYTRFDPVDLAAVDRDPRGARPRPAPDALDPRGGPGRVRPPAGRRAQADQPPDRRVVRDDLRHRQLLPPPPLRADRARRSPSAAARPA